MPAATTGCRAPLHTHTRLEPRRHRTGPGLGIVPMEDAQAHAPVRGCRPRRTSRCSLSEPISNLHPISCARSPQPGAASRRTIALPSARSCSSRVRLSARMAATRTIAFVFSPARSGRALRRPSDRAGSWRRTTPSPRGRSHTLDADEMTVGCNLVLAYGLSTGAWRWGSTSRTLPGPITAVDARGEWRRTSRTLSEQDLRGHEGSALRLDERHVYQRRGLGSRAGCIARRTHTSLTRSGSAAPVANKVAG